MLKERIITGREHQSLEVDFRMLHTAILEEPALLHPTLDAMQESFAVGLGVTSTIEQAGKHIAVGYSRVIPLLSPEQRDALGLPNDFPDVYELGTVFVYPDYRGRGIAEELQKRLILGLKEGIDNESLLILGTTKTTKVLHMLDKLAQDGVEFYHCRHTEFPHIAPLTCICSPDFGEGFQYTRECSKRVSEPQVVFIRSILPKSEPFVRPTIDKIPCTMFVSSRNLATRMDQTLASIFANPHDTQGEMVTRLQEMEYFE